MKKTLLLLFALLAGFFTLKAQTIYTTDFDALTAGTRLATQTGNPWTTWSLAPGGSEDPYISSTQAHSGANTVYVVNNNDCVLQLSDKTSGRYKVEWFMYVESGKLGYFNLLSDFAAGSSKWAFQAYMYHDSIFIDANGYHTASATFASNTWTKMTLIIDLDDDFATFYKNDVEVISYQWSKGAQGTDNSLKLDGINFYGWDGTDSPAEGGQSGYYIDDVTFDSIAAPGGTLSAITATLNGNDIDVSWTAATPSPELYKLSRNGMTINSTTGTNYTDIHPWPDTYDFVVRGYYNVQGYSHASNTATVTITGGVTRDLVLFEKGTSTNCAYCPYAAQGFKALIETNHKNAVGIAYHPTSPWGSFADAYGNSFSQARLMYYSISGFPSVISDGKWRINGVVQPYTSQYSDVYLPWYNDRIATASFHTLDLSVIPTGTDTYTATIIVGETFNAWPSVKLHAVLTESNIPVSWNGQTEVDYVCRGMYPNANGTTLDFTSQNPQTVTLNFSTSGYVKNNCQFVVFIQDESSKLVSQVAKIDMSAVVGTEEITGNSISIYPNPASEYIMTMTSGNGIIEIFDITGKLVSKNNILKTTEIIDIRGLEKGIYVIKITSKENSFTEKLLIE